MSKETKLSGKQQTQVYHYNHITDMSFIYYHKWYQQSTTKSWEKLSTKDFDGPKVWS